MAAAHSWKRLSLSYAGTALVTTCYVQLKFITVPKHLFHEGECVHDWSLRGNFGAAVYHWGTKQALEVSFTKISNNSIKQLNITCILLASEGENLIKWGKNSIIKHERVGRWWLIQAYSCTSSLELLAWNELGVIKRLNMSLLHKNLL